MFMQNSVDEVWPTGIRRARLVSDRKVSSIEKINKKSAFSCIGHCWRIIVVVTLLLAQHLTKTASLNSCSIEEFIGDLNCLCESVISEEYKVDDKKPPFCVICGIIQILILSLREIIVKEFDTFILSRLFLDLLDNHRVGFPSSYFDVSVVVFTVRALYAGTLVTSRTTAPCHHSPFRRYSVLLAALCLILATLTIAARCYASTNTLQSIVQLPPNPQHTFSPIFIKYSNSQHTSRIVLSRIFPNPRKHVQSDTSVIENSKQFIYNQKNINYRRKREYSRNNQLEKFYNYNQENSLGFDGKNPVLGTNEIPHKTPESLDYQHSNNVLINQQNTPSLLDERTQSNQIPNRVLPTHKYTVNFPKDISTDNPDIIPVISVSARNKSVVNPSRVTSTLLVEHQNDPKFDPVFGEKPSLGSGTKRPMPPAHDHDNNSLVESGALLLVVLLIVVIAIALGLITCVLSHYRGGTAANPDAPNSPSTTPMLSVVSAGATAGVGGMDRLRGRGAARELAASSDRQVRLHTVHTDIAINLPPSISLPDGEEHPFNSRLHIRDTEQESEIYQKCIRPPPNRTVLESESPPSYRSSSAGYLGSTGGSSSGSSEWSGGSGGFVVRCNSMSSTSKRPDAGPSGQKTDFIQKTVKILTGKKSQPSPAPTLPPVIVPSRTRRTTEHHSTGRPKPNV